MSDRHEAKLLGHAISIEWRFPKGYEISIAGPMVSAKCPDRFLTLSDAKIEAHAFAHSALRAVCECVAPLEWRIYPQH